MFRLIFLVLFLIAFQGVYSQFDIDDVKKLHRLPFVELLRGKQKEKDSLPSKESQVAYDGTMRLTVNQSYFSNWISGGESAVIAQYLFDYDIRYRNANGLVWDNQFTFSLGGTYTAGRVGIRKADDQFIWNSLIGTNKRKWNISVFSSLKTQIFSGYSYSEKENQQVKTKESSFFSPGIIQLGLGFFRIKTDKSRINISPLTAQVVIVNKSIAEQMNLDKPYFGVPPGKSIQGYLGASINGYYKTELWENISLDYRYEFYANYLKEIKNVDFKQSITLVFKVNQFVSCTLNTELFYDDDLLADLQVKEIFGLGINYDI